MARLLARAVLSVLGAAIGLIVASVLLGDFRLRPGGFITTVLIFSVVQLVVTPLIRQVALKHAPALLGGTALVATLVSLLLATIFGSSIDISGLATWVLAAIVVWATSLAAAVVLPMVLFKNVLSESGRERT